jgi:two-component system sensor histidine kinase ComP
MEELLLNACRHSRSKNVLLGLAQDEESVCVQVQDWGVGFEPEKVEPQRLGLQGVRQLVGRLGGTVEIDSRPGVGTCVFVEVPLSDGANSKGRRVMVDQEGQIAMVPARGLDHHAR